MFIVKCSQGHCSFQSDNKRQKVGKHNLCLPPFRFSTSHWKPLSFLVALNVCKEIQSSQRGYDCSLGRNSWYWCSDLKDKNGIESVIMNPCSRWKWLGSSSREGVQYFLSKKCRTHYFLFCLSSGRSHQRLCCGFAVNISNSWHHNLYLAWCKLLGKETFEQLIFLWTNRKHLWIHCSFSTFVSVASNFVLYLL